MRSGSDPYTEFAELAARPAEDIDLAQAALVIARSEYPNIAVGDYLARLDDMANAVAARTFGARPATTVLQTMNDYLFAEQGYSGNVQDYFDPRNSFLNDVIDRRLGIPISLSIIYLEVGRRLGLALQGVSFPGHFLVKLGVSGGDVVIDPFLRGVSLSREELEHRLAEAHRGRHRPQPDLADVLVAASTRDILVRMLRNLKGIYVKKGDFERALRMVQHVLQLRPHDPRETRDRGYIYLRLECVRAANADFQRYLELAPEAEDAEDIRARYIDTLQAGARLH